MSWSQPSSSKANAKNFKNCIHPPVIKANRKTFLDTNPPPELNLMLGVVNTLYANMIIRKWENLSGHKFSSPPELHLMLGVVNTLYANMIKDGFEKDAQNWEKSCNVQRE